jgi:hypothetical protein
MRKLSPKAEAKIIATNSGYWDGVADRERGKLARWYRGCHKNCGHFDVSYAEGYALGVWGKEAPPYALTGQAES